MLWVVTGIEYVWGDLGSSMRVQINDLGIRIEINEIWIQKIKLKKIHTGTPWLVVPLFDGYKKKTHFYIVVKPIIIIIITSNTKYQDDTILCGKILLKDVRKP